MDTDVMNISFDDFQSVSSNVLMNLWKNKDSADVTLVANDGRKHLRAHKIVLSSSSSLFCDILSQCQDQNPVIFLQGIYVAILEQILKFVYTGICQIHQSDLKVFLSSGTALGIRGLADYAESGNGIESSLKFERNEDVLLGDSAHNNTSTDLSLENGPAAEIMSLAHVSANVDGMVGIEETVSVSQHAKDEAALDGNNSEGEIVTVGHLAEEGAVSDNCHAANGEKVLTDLHVDKENVSDNQMKGQGKTGQSKDDDFSLVVSRKKGTSKKIGRFPCDLCGRVYKYKDGLRGHMRQHSPDFKKFSCTECDFQNSRKSIVKDHRETMHEGKTYKCDQCGFEPKNKLSLRRHIRTQHINYIRRYCNICDYSSRKQEMVNWHKRSIHEGLRIPCDQCDKQFNFPGGLYMHKKHAHQQHQVDFVCTECDFTTNNKTSLSYHLEKHGTNEHSCSQCTYKTKVAKHLRAHLKREHRDHFQCDQCNYSSKQKIHLDIHVKSKHEGVSFTCNLCNYKASQSSNLTRHKNTKHKTTNIDKADVSES